MREGMVENQAQLSSQSQEILSPRSYMFEEGNNKSTA